MGIAVWTGCTCAIVRAERTMASSMSGVIRSVPLQLRVAGTLFALLAIAPAHAGASTILPNGTYVYDIAEDGKTEATSTIVVTRTPDEIVVTEHASPMEAGEITRRIYDGASFAARAFANEVDGRTYATVTVNGRSAAIDQGGRKSTLTAPAGAPFAVFDANVSSVFQLPAMLHAQPNNRLTLANLFFGISTMAVTAAPATVPRPARVPAGDVGTQIALDGKPAALWYDPVSYVLDEFDTPSARIAFVLTKRSDAITPLP